MNTRFNQKKKLCTGAKKDSTYNDLTYDFQVSDVDGQAINFTSAQQPFAPRDKLCPNLFYNLHALDTDIKVTNLTPLQLQQLDNPINNPIQNNNPGLSRINNHDFNQASLKQLPPPQQANNPANNFCNNLIYNFSVSETDIQVTNFTPSPQTQNNSKLSETHKTFNQVNISTNQPWQVQQTYDPLSDELNRLTKKIIKTGEVDKQKTSKNNLKRKTKTTKNTPNVRQKSFHNDFLPQQEKPMDANQPHEVTTLQVLQSSFTPDHDQIIPNQAGFIVMQNLNISSPSIQPISQENYSTIQQQSYSQQTCDLVDDDLAQFDKLRNAAKQRIPENTLVDPDTGIAATKQELLTFQPNGKGKGGTIIKNGRPFKLITYHAFKTKVWRKYSSEREWENRLYHLDGRSPTEQELSTFKPKDKGKGGYVRDESGQLKELVTYQAQRKRKSQENPDIKITQHARRNALVHLDSHSPTEQELSTLKSNSEKKSWYVIDENDQIKELIKRSQYRRLNNTSNTNEKSLVYADTSSYQAVTEKDLQRFVKLKGKNSTAIINEDLQVREVISRHVYAQRKSRAKSMGESLNQSQFYYYDPYQKKYLSVESTLFSTDENTFYCYINGKKVEAFPKNQLWKTLILQNNEEQTETASQENIQNLDAEQNPDSTQTLPLSSPQTFSSIPLPGSFSTNRFDLFNSIVSRSDTNIETANENQMMNSNEDSYSLLFSSLNDK